MISYELAKELKEVGFPQGCTAWVFYLLQTSDNKPHSLLRIRNTLGGYKFAEILDCIDAPDLSDLISWCGDDFEALYHRVHNKTWVSASSQVMMGGYSTPEEAVACLGMAIHKK